MKTLNTQEVQSVAGGCLISLFPLFGGLRGRGSINNSFNTTNIYYMNNVPSKPCDTTTPATNLTEIAVRK